ncbi:MAG TPA: hypothetical protein DGG94_14000 [Micromonosporaceae bacterium]|nr:hypothetical protein [Micromonosporaceae bacterium]
MFVLLGVAVGVSLPGGVSAGVVGVTTTPPDGDPAASLPGPLTVGLHAAAPITSAIAPTPSTKRFIIFLPADVLSHARYLRLRNTHG